MAQMLINKDKLYFLGLQDDWTYVCGFVLVLAKVVVEDLEGLGFNLFVELVFAVVFVFNETAD